MRLRTLRTILWGLVLITAAAVAGVMVGRLLQPQEPAGRSMAAAFAQSGYEAAGGPFRLLGEDGEVVTEADLAGKPRAMFFGFTHCPDVCPTHLLDAVSWLDALGEDADRLQMVFVSVDPERDTFEVLNAYADAFDERIIALTAADEATLRAVAERYKVRYEKVPLAEAGYTMNHTADTLLFDAAGKFAGFIPYMAPNERADPELATAEREENVATLRALVAR